MDGCRDKGSIRKEEEEKKKDKKANLEKKKPQKPETKPNL
jgi:hypothetical protein